MASVQQGATGFQIAPVTTQEEDCPVKEGQPPFAAHCVPSVK